MKTLRILPCLLGLVAAGCGDEGTTTASGTDGTQGTTATTATTAMTATATMTPTSSATDSASGTAGETEGLPTTSSPGPTSTTGSTTDEPGTSTTVATGTSTGTTGAISGTSGESTSTTGDPPPCEPGDSGGMGDVEKSFLWVANTDQGSISKVDTQGVVELARYRSGPNGGGESPSRTAVSVDGRFVVVNNRSTGRATMIAADPADCVDSNANGMIDTSQNPVDLRAWGSDECVVWSTMLPFLGGESAGPRAVTWTPGTWDKNLCAFVDPKVWIGYLPAQAATAHMARLDGATGKIEETVTIPNWFVGDTSWGPYGAALDKNLDVWFTGLRGELFRLNTAMDPVTVDRWTPGFDLQFYGMTVDPDGDPWFAGNCGPVSTFDPVKQQFIAVPGTENGCYRGIGADKDGHVWAADNGICGVMQIDHVTNTMVKFHALQPCTTPVGVSVDEEGFVWIVDEWEGAWKIDPMNPDAKQFLPISSQHYTYSDMTGGQLKSVVLPQ
jgi:hypothetical protein